MQRTAKSSASHLERAAVGVRSHPERITIIGMGPIGASIGLGLKRAGLKNTEVVGTDGNRGALNQAYKMGALDLAIGNLRSALNGARLVILDTPLSETREFLEEIGHSLDKSCVVTDTMPAKVQVMEWAQSYLPPGTSFVGGHPLTKKTVTRLDEANDALLNGIYYCVIPAASADPEAVRTVVGMVEALHAKPLFLDAHEHDSYTSAMAHLPQLLACALVNATADSPSWKEMHRLAGSEFREASQMASNDPEESASALCSSPEYLVHWLDQLIAQLNSYRDLVKGESDGQLLEALIHSWEERARWQMDAVTQESESEVARATQSMTGIFVGRRLVERSRQIGNLDKRAPWQYPRRKGRRPEDRSTQ